MAIDASPFRASLATRGRTTGKSHTVTLRGVRYNDKIYFSRHRPDSDWFKNAILNPEVVIKYKDSLYSGTATMVTDEKLNQMISQLKYPGEKRAEEKRVALEITPHELL